ncbi:MAG: hypothetical protein AABX70_03600 [Nanoarchaeota archaeon]
MSTDISGTFSKQEIEQVRTNLTPIFPTEVDGFCNNKPTKYEVHLKLGYDFEPGFGSFVMPYLIVEEVLKGNIVDFIDNPTLRDRRTWNSPLYCTTALIFPEHCLVLSDNVFFKQHYPDALKALTAQGYTVVESQEGGHLHWTRKIKLEVLATLRNPALTNLKAADFRATEILTILSDHLPEEAESYTFGIFTPKWRKRPIEIEYDDVREGELVVKRVKKLVDVHRSWANNSLEGLVKGLALARAVGLTSRVKTQNGVKHIPMIDFGCGQVAAVRDTLTSLSAEGMIVNSGNSYHFYGFNLLSEAEWQAWIGELENRVNVDEHWPELQRAQDYAMLRLTPSRGKLYQPRFVELYPNQRPVSDGRAVRSQLHLVA